MSLSRRDAAENRVVLARLALQNAALHAAGVRERLGDSSVPYQHARKIHNGAVAEYCAACLALNDVDAGVPEVRA